MTTTSHRILRSVLTTIAVLILMNSVKAQEPLKIKANVDSTHIEKFDDWVVLKTSVINTSDALIIKTDNINYIFQPNASEAVRTYLSYRFLSFYMDYLPHGTVVNNDDTEKGHTKLFTLGTNINVHQWFAELNYTNTRGYYLENTKDYQPNWQTGDPYLQIPALRIISFDGAIGFNTNPRASLLAASTQTERQLKSAGAFLPKITYRYYIIDNQTQGSAFTQKSNNLQGLIGAGYQYTLVFKKSFYLLGAFIPSFGYIHSKVLTRTADGNSTFTNGGPIYQWDGKLGLGYNGHRIFTGVYLTAVSAKYAQGLTTAENQNANIFFQVFLGVRLKAPKAVNKIFDKILH